MKVTTLVLFALFALFALGCSGAGAGHTAELEVPEGQVWLSAQQVAAAKLTIATAAPAVIPRRVMSAGRIGFDPQHVAHIFSPVTGRVTQILVDLGARVQKGQPLATIDSPDGGIASADLGKALADVQAAERTLVATLGLLPAAISNGVGAQTQKPLAVVVIGGSLILALLTQLLHPPLLVVVHRWQERRPKNSNHKASALTLADGASNESLG